MDDHRTKRDQLVQEIRRRIVSGEYPRGSKLGQDELAAQFGVSITPVREALRLLENERLVVSEPHKGVRVSGIDLERIDAAYVLRRLTESFAARRAAFRMSRHDLAVLKQMLDEADAAAGDADFDSYEANRAFHFYIYERCGLPELTKRIAEMWSSFPWDLMLGDAVRTDDSRHEHRTIVEALDRGDADDVARALENHLAGGMAALRSHLTGSEGEDPFDAD
ncbi:MAG: hypothetical protein QOG18_2006 [Microbacteriaceae bacterium]|nr:hypothetical protein [Microbacteriaceae bacterium]MDQ1527393.1 hypothetical protein [Microbacteriaceae bacterium]